MWGGQGTAQAPLRLIFGQLTPYPRSTHPPLQRLIITTLRFLTPALQTNGTEGLSMETVNTSNDPMVLSITRESIINNGLKVLNSIDPASKTGTLQEGTGIKITGLRAAGRFEEKEKLNQKKDAQCALHTSLSKCGTFVLMLSLWYSCKEH